MQITLIYIVLYIYNIQKNTHTHTHYNKYIHRSYRVQKQKQKLFEFLHTSNEKSKKEVRKNNSIYNNIQRIKDLGTNLTKEVKDLYSENYKTSLEDIEEDLTKLQDISFVWIRRQYCYRSNTA